MARILSPASVAGLGQLAANAFVPITIKTALPEPTIMPARKVVKAFCLISIALPRLNEIVNV